MLTFTFSDPVSITEIELQNLLDDEGFKRNYKIQGYLITTDDLSVEFSGRLDNVNDRTIGSRGLIDRDVSPFFVCGNGRGATQQAGPRLVLSG